MTKKHFKALAEELRGVRPEGEFSPQRQREFLVWSRCIHAVEDVCREVNPRFDRERFRTACGYYENNDTLKYV